MGVYMADEEARQRKLQAAAAAAGSAVGWGCTKDEVRAAVEAAMAEALGETQRALTIVPDLPAGQPSALDQFEQTAARWAA